MALTPPRRSVKLARPVAEPGVEEARIERRGAVWRASPPVPQAEPQNKRANRPKLLEPLPEGDIWSWNREASFAGAVLIAVLSALGTWAGILPHRHSSGVDCVRCDDR